jgi:hypothetical protein
MVAGDYEWATSEALLATWAEFKRQSDAFMCATYEVLILPRVIALVCALPILSFIGSMAALFCYRASRI